MKRQLTVLVSVSVIWFGYCAPAAWAKGANEAASASVPATLLVQKLQNLGRTKWFFAKNFVKVDLPIASMLYDSRTSKATFYSYKTRRFVESDVDSLIRQMKELRPRRTEQYGPWKKLGLREKDGRKVVVYERAITKGAVNRPKHVTVNETLFASKDMTLSPNVVRLFNAVTGEEFGYGMPLHVERRAYSTVRKDLGKVPFIMLETVTMSKYTLLRSDMKVPAGFTRAESVNSILLEDTQGVDGL
ncbi:MAG: hypothetical protein SFV17_20025 [Candidatus Obscuribacter sp.]|nr:hypothetical protein [Candidatus Obscuribacter sp.]